MSIETVMWSRESWPHEHDYGADRGWVATYNGHELSIRENGGPFTVYVDGEPLPRDDGHEGAKVVHDADQGKAYAQDWVDGKVKRPAKGALLAPEFGFGFYRAATGVMVSHVVDGKFEVQIEDPCKPYDKRVSKIFREGQDPTEWTARQVANQMKKWLRNRT